MMITKLITFAPICYLLAISNAYSDSRTCRVIYPDRPAEAPKEIFIYDGVKSHHVRLLGMNFSEVTKLSSAKNSISLFRHPVDEPSENPVSDLVLEIPENVRDFYIILSPNFENKPLPVDAKIVHANVEELRPGHTVWLNFTEHNIIAELGDTDMEVGPDGKAISKRPSSSDGYFTASFYYQPSDKEKLAPISNQRWWHDDESRYLGLIMKSGGRLPNIYSFRDFR